MAKKKQTNYEKLLEAQRYVGHIPTAAEVAAAMDYLRRTEKITSKRQGVNLTKTSGDAARNQAINVLRASVDPAKAKGAPRPRSTDTTTTTTTTTTTDMPAPAVPNSIMNQPPPRAGGRAVRGALVLPTVRALRSKEGRAQSTKPGSAGVYRTTEHRPGSVMYDVLLARNPVAPLTPRQRAAGVKSRAPIGFTAAHTPVYDIPKPKPPKPAAKPKPKARRSYAPARGAPIEPPKTRAQVGLGQRRTKKRGKSA